MQVEKDPGSQSLFLEVVGPLVVEIWAFKDDTVEGNLSLFRLTAHNLVH